MREDYFVSAIKPRARIHTKRTGIVRDIISTPIWSAMARAVDKG